MVYLPGITSKGLSDVACTIGTLFCICRRIRNVIIIEFSELIMQSSLVKCMRLVQKPNGSSNLCLVALQVLLLFTNLTVLTYTLHNAHDIQLTKVVNGQLVLKLFKLSDCDLIFSQQLQTLRLVRTFRIPNLRHTTLPIYFLLLLVSHQRGGLIIMSPLPLSGMFFPSTSKKSPSS